MPSSPPVRGRPATRADVARHAGVSTAVVSYVVNEGPRRVAPRTAARVRAAIAELQYYPNANARALSTGSTGMVGLIVPDVTNPYFAELARGVGEAAAARGFIVTLGNSGAREDVEQRLVDLAGRQVDGVLLATVRPPLALEQHVLPHRPMVLINSAAPSSRLLSIGSDARQGARDVVLHLIEVHGHTSVALVVGESAEPVPEARERGFVDAFARHELPPGPVVRTAYSAAGGFDALRRILTWRTRPAAVFVSSDQQAFGAYRALREAGLECPADIALAAYDGTTQSQFCWPPLTVARQPVREMAEAAIDIVLAPSSAPVHHRFANELVVRRSCGCVT